MIRLNEVRLGEGKNLKNKFIYLVFDTIAMSQEWRPMLEVDQIHHYFLKNVLSIPHQFHRVRGMTCSCNNFALAYNSHCSRYMLIFRLHNNIALSTEWHRQYFQLH